MKTMTCAQMGGMCNEKITAATADEMIAKGMDHMKVAHPEMAASIAAMPKDHPAIVEWQEKFTKEWDATPEGE